MPRLKPHGRSLKISVALDLDGRFQPRIGGKWVSEATFATAAEALQAGRAYRAQMRSELIKIMAERFKSGK